MSIDKGSNAFYKLGRSFYRSKYCVPMSLQSWFAQFLEGSSIKCKERVHYLTLHDFNIINSCQQGFLDLLAGGTDEIKPKTLDKIDYKITVVHVPPGVLFTCEVHVLDTECFLLLNSELESFLSYVLDITTNIGVTIMRGTDYKSHYSMSSDLLNHLIMLLVKDYTMKTNAQCY